jgi:hypothetical protein
MSDTRRLEIKAKLYDLKVQADVLKEKYETALAPLAKEFKCLMKYLVLETMNL